MALAIRLARQGRRNRPFYRIVVADKRMPRDGRYIEKLGTYNPLLKDDNEDRVRLNKERIEHWLSQGAKPSERVAIFLGKAGLIEMPKQSSRPQKSEPSEKTKMKMAEKEEKQKAAAEAAKEAEDAAKAEAEQAAAAEAEAESAADDSTEQPAETDATEAGAEETAADSDSSEDGEKPAEG